MTNPVLQALLEAKVSDLIAPPRSWGRAEKLAFLKLPHDLQLFYSKREAQRDQEVRRCQNEAAKANAELAKVKQELAALKQTLEEKDGAEQIAVA